MTFERTRDLNLVRQILITPCIWRHIGDDSTPPVDQWAPPAHESIWYVIATEGNEVLGCFIFRPETAVCWDVHTALLPAAIAVRERSLRAARGVLQWMWEHSPCLRIITRVPSCNPLALRFAQKADMMEWGRNPGSWLKGGKLFDQIYLGIDKPEVR